MSAAPDTKPALSAISVSHVSKTYRIQRDRPHSLKEALVRRKRWREVQEFEALTDVSLEVPVGSFYGIIGHNGSGKSTLLKLIAGIYQVNSGDIRVRGRLAGLLELGSGFHPELSGRDNIYLNAAIMGLRRRQIDATIDSIIDFAGIGDFVDAPVKVLSSGMYVRLGFAVAVHVHADVLLLDEVIAVGDEAFQRKCLERLAVLKAAGTTIVLVSHSQLLMIEHCDQVAWMDHGRVRDTGPAGEICNAYVESVIEAESATPSVDAGS